MPRATRTRRSFSIGFRRARSGRAGCSRRVRPEHGEEGLLRDLHRADPLHPALALLLLLEQLPLPGDVATVAFGQHVLAHRPHGFARHHVRSDGGLDGHLEHLARDELAQPAHQRPAERLRVLPVDDHRQRVDRLARDEHVDPDEVRRPVADLLVVHRGIARGARLELVVVVDDQLRERQLEAHEDARRVEVLEVDEGAAPARRQLHERADVGRGRHHRQPDPWLADLLDVVDRWQLRRVVDADRAASVGPKHLVFDRGRRRDEVERELALEALLDDLHVQQPEEAAPEPEPERDRALRLEGERGVVEVELLDRVAQQRVVLAGDRVDAGEDQALGLLVAGQRLPRRAGRRGDRVADLRLAHVLQARGDVADLARAEQRHGDELGPEHAQLQELCLRPRRHQPDPLVSVQGPSGKPDVDHHALVGVVVAVEDERLEWRAWIALGRRDALDDGLQHLGHARALLGRDEQHLLAGDGERVLQLVHHQLRLGRGQVDLVEHRHDGQALAQGEVDVGQGLRLDALGGVDDQDRALARLEAAADLVAEVHVARRVDQVEAVGEPVLRRVLQAHGAGLDRDALLTLEVHRVEDLARHLARVDRVRQLQQPIGERRLAMVDVRDDVCGGGGGGGGVLLYS